jgi:para-nitrobenzyl esterase
MVWIPGGGNFAGASSLFVFDGEKLARHGVVVLTMNYRLGVFGFFSHPQLTRESPHRASGNQGILDQIAALKWVHDNIVNFGGNTAVNCSLARHPNSAFRLPWSTASLAANFHSP